MQYIYRFVIPFLEKSSLGKGILEHINKNQKIYEIVEALLVALILALIIRATCIQAFKIPSKSMVPTLGVGDRIFVNKFIYWFTEPKVGDIIVFRTPDEIYDPEKPIYIKRVVGTPGDYIDIVDNKLVVNEETVDIKVYVHNLSDYNSFAKQFFDLQTEQNDRQFIQRFFYFAGVPIDYTTNRLKVNGELIAQPIFTIDNIYYDDMARGNNFNSAKIPEGVVFVFGDNSQSSSDSRYWKPGGLGVPLKNIKGKAFFRYWPPERIGLIR